MQSISAQRLQAYRRQTFRINPGAHLHTREQAVDYVNERGFIFFWPIKGCEFPSLWTAVAGDRPVADFHDDPGHVTWGWKDSLLGQKRWFYAKVLRKRATILSLEVFPYFYALSENYGSPDEDYLTLYEQGCLTQEAKAIYEALLDSGPLDTIALRKAARLSSPESEGRFNKALTDLQADFKVLPAGVTEAGAWNYAYAYDIVTRQFPEIIDQAQSIGDTAARQKLAELYFRSMGAAQPRDLSRIFGWAPLQVQRTLTRLVQAGQVQGGLTQEQAPGEWLAIPELVDP